MSVLDGLPSLQIDGFRLGPVVGQGGMSIVYRAEDVRLGRTVALKIIEPGRADDHDSRRRFLREARVAAMLDHPNILPIYEVGEVGGRLYIAMRYVDGTDLGTAITRGIRTDEVASILVQIAAGLDAAHGTGLVHRDVKPQNVLVASGEGSEPSGHTYLADFGLTKDLRANSRWTATGQLVGSVNYVAPEVIRDQKVDRRCDIYSLGCVLYECLTGQPPYEKESDLATIWAHVEDDAPSVRVAGPELPIAIDDVIAVALAKDPRDRYGSCGELAEDVVRLLGPSSHQYAKPVTAKRLRAGDPGAYRIHSASAPDLYRSGRTPGGKRAASALVLGIAAAVIAGTALAGVWDRPQANPKAQDVSTASGAGAPVGAGEAGAERQGRKEVPEGRKASPASREDPFGLSFLLPQPETPLADEVTDTSLPASPAPALYPDPGTYLYRQFGHARLCQERDGYEVCTGKSNLANRQVFKLAHSPGLAGRDLVLAESTSDSYATETVSAFGKRDALVTKMTGRFRHSNVDFSFSYKAHPAIEIYRFPLSVGKRWAGSWTGRVSGRYASEVAEKDSVLAGRRRVSAFRIDSLTRMSGDIKGWMVTSEWIDPTTNAIVRRVTDLHLRNEVAVYRAFIDLRLLSGPGYQ